MSNNTNKANPKKQYWLGQGKISEQDTFFIEALDKNLWQAGTQDHWDTCWQIDMPDSSTYEQLSATQTINHIPGNNALTIKSSLNDTLTQARDRLNGSPQEKRFDFFPQTFEMPKDYYAFQACAMKNPDWMWIQKPKNLSRGRGIEVVKHPSAVPLDDEWIIQRYLSEPHLYNNHKYVLRCYVLITSVEPLRFYWYQEGFAKLASESYSNDDLDNPYRHLTNPDINEENTDAETPVTFYSFKQYRQWLKDQGHNDEQLFGQLKELIGLTVISARETMRERSNTATEKKGCYELIGLDCMLDNNLKPWILECNLSPSLATYATNTDDKTADKGPNDSSTNSSTNSLANSNSEIAIKKQLVSDLVNMIGLNSPDDIINLAVHEKMAWEHKYKGQFECIFPVFSQANNNHNSNNSGNFLLPNDVASWIWLKNSEGLSPTDIAHSLADAQEKPANLSDGLFQEQQLKQIWDTLSEWSYAGAFTKPPKEKPYQLGNQWHTLSRLSLPTLLGHLTLRIGCPIVADYLKSWIENEDSTEQYKTDEAINIIRSDYGYLITYQSQVIAEQCKLSEILPKIFNDIKRRTTTDKHITTIKGCVIHINDKNILVANDQLAVMDSFAKKLCQQHSGAIISGAPLLKQSMAIASQHNLPIYLPIEEYTPTKTDKLEALKVGSIHTTNYWLAPTPYKTKNNSDDINIDQIIFPEKIYNLEHLQINKLATAKALEKLWQHSIKKEASTARQMAEWIKTTPSISVEFSDSDSAVSEISQYI